jgi:beta-phosphoglucomutase
MPFKALIFDLDGVIADTIRAHEAGWELVANQFGVPVTPELLFSFRGKRRHDILHTITGRTLSETEFNTAMTAKVAHYDAFLAQMSPAHILPGVEALIAAGRARGMGLAVASSSYNARAVLEKLGLVSRFDVIADGPTVARAKPFPDIFVWAAGALRVRPGDCIVFEDAEAGVIAGRDAGMFVVGVGNPAHLAGANLVVPDLTAVDLAALSAL